MSTTPNQLENLQSDAKPEDPSLDRQEEEEEEEGECGFCLFMKGGSCKDTFIDWENCVKEAEDKKEDLVDKCSQITARLKHCMNSYSNYYAPIFLWPKSTLKNKLLLNWRRKTKIRMLMMISNRKPLLSLIKSGFQYQFLFFILI
ncbi:hypothetical protein QL285_038731 [Trifolium repens]|nr:hypothetical protein QL285_038731 [Trifolium repens]